jgi:hypothetical protein
MPIEGSRSRTGGDRRICSGSGRADGDGGSSLAVGSVVAAAAGVEDAAVGADFGELHAPSAMQPSNTDAEAILDRRRQAPGFIGCERRAVVSCPCPVLRRARPGSAAQ